MKKKGLMVIIIWFVFFLAANFSFLKTNEVVAQTKSETIELRYAGWLPKGQMIERMPEYWAEELNKRTNGKVKVTNYFGNL